MRILAEGLQTAGAQLITCHTPVWDGIEDKSQIKRLTGRVRSAFRWIAAYPRLVYRYLRLPPHDVVLIGYMGQLDVLVLWPFAKLRGVPMAWDAFISLYDTVVSDRHLLSKQHPLAWGLRAWEWLACRAATLVILDTQAHADWFATQFNLPPKRLAKVLVGAEPERFYPAAARLNAETNPPARPLRVLFYGQFIPLHGIATIVAAARLCADRDIDWTLIGTGQEAPQCRAMLAEHPLPRVHWEPYTPYEQLIEWIHGADVCLGIFGTSDKAGRVIPNKVFQIIAADRPLITRDSPAIREILEPGPAVTLIPAGNPEALAQALIARMTGGDLDSPPGAWVHDPALRRRITPTAIGAQLDQVLRRALEGR